MGVIIGKRWIAHSELDNAIAIQVDRGQRFTVVGPHFRSIWKDGAEHAAVQAGVEVHVLTCTCTHRKVCVAISIEITKGAEAGTKSIAWVTLDVEKFQSFGSALQGNLPGNNKGRTRIGVRAWNTYEVIICAVIVDISGIGDPVSFKMKRGMI